MAVDQFAKWMLMRKLRNIRANIRVKSTTSALRDVKKSLMKILKNMLKNSSNKKGMGIL